MKYSVAILACLLSSTAFAQDNSRVAEALGFDYAKEQNLTGAGVEVGVLDDGIDWSLPELAHIKVTNVDFGTHNGQLRNKAASENSVHGTPVTVILAGKTMGMSPGVSVINLRADEYSYGVMSHPAHTHAAALDYATAHKLKLVNRSYTFGSVDIEVLQNSMDKFADTGGLLINSSGNEGRKEPSALGITESNRESVLFVGSVQMSPSGRILPTIYSNRAGSYADRYLVAFGDVTSIVYGEKGPASGTSFAAPEVTAAGAIILQKWPHLSGQEVGTILLETARDIGEPGIDETYGHGLLDLRNALTVVLPTYKQMVMPRRGLKNPTITLYDELNRSVEVALFSGIKPPKDKRRLLDLYEAIYTSTTSVQYDPNLRSITKHPIVYKYKNLFVIPSGGIGVGTEHIRLFALQYKDFFYGESRQTISSLLLDTSYTHMVGNSSIKFSGSIAAHRGSSSSFYSTQWSISGTSGAVTLGVSQPMRIEAGHLTIPVPYRVVDNKWELRNQNINLKSKRTVDIFGSVSIASFRGGARYNLMSNDLILHVSYRNEF